MGTDGASSARGAVPGIAHWRKQQQVLWYRHAHLPERAFLLREIGFGFDPYSGKGSFDAMCDGIAALQAQHGVDSVMALLVRLYEGLMAQQALRAGMGQSRGRHRAGLALVSDRAREMAGHAPPAEAEAEVARATQQVRQIGRWCKIQLARHRDGSLSVSEKQRLNDLGMIWEGYEWQINFESLLKFRAVYGHCDVDLDSKQHRLAEWVANMRLNRHDLPYEYKQLLNMVGFTWEKRGAWARMFAQLRGLRGENGRVVLSDQDVHLIGWLMNQRALLQRGKLTMHQINQLKSAGIL